MNVEHGEKIFEFASFADCRDTMRDLIAQGVKVQMCVTSPPYFGLRDYGHPGQLGLEATPAEFVRAMVEVFGLVRELLADDGVRAEPGLRAITAGKDGTAWPCPLTFEITGASGHRPRSVLVD